MEIKECDTRLPKGDMSGILLRDCNWSVKTAGPSPDDNNRTELFLLGCKKAMSGNPCKGCFNSTTWDKSKAQWSHDPIKMAKHINDCAPNKYITIGGGEPTDQLDNLIILTKELKKYGFHIMMYTWKDLKGIINHPYTSFENATEKINKNSAGYYVLESTYFSTKVRELLKYVDIIVDGEYKEELRLWDGTKEDGLVSSVGSGNQIIWDIKDKIGYAMKDIDYLWINPENNNLLYVLKNLECETHTLKY